MAAPAGVAGAAHRFGVDVDDHPVDQIGDPLIGQRVPGRGLGGELGVDDGDDVGVDDQCGAGQDEPQHPQIHGAGGEHVGEGGQSGEQVAALGDQRAGPAAADTQLRTQLRSRQFPVIDNQILKRVAELGHSGQGEPPGGQHLGGHGAAFGAQLVARGIEVAPHISTVEHMCNYARRV